MVAAARGTHAGAHRAGARRRPAGTNPIYTNLNWHGLGCGPFKTSEQAYDTLHIGSIEGAKELQEAEKARREIELQRGAKVR